MVTRTWAYRPAALRTAWRAYRKLAGRKPENAATLEMTLAGATLQFDEARVIALTGGECDCRINGDTASMWQAMQVPARGILECGALKAGARLYLAIQGGLDVESIMGSASTNMAGPFGGLEGRALSKGDLLGVRKGPNSRLSTLKPGAVDELYSREPLRATRGAQHDWFGVGAFGKFFSCPYTERAIDRPVCVEGRIDFAASSIPTAHRGVSLGQFKCLR